MQQVDLLSLMKYQTFLDAWSKSYNDDEDMYTKDGLNKFLQEYENIIHLYLHHIPLVKPNGNPLETIDGVRALIHYAFCLIKRDNGQPHDLHTIEPKKVIKPILRHHDDKSTSEPTKPIKKPKTIKKTAKSDENKMKTDDKLKADEEAAKLKADEEAKIKADEAAKLKDDEEAAKIKADEAAKIKADEEAAKLKADEEAKIKADEEAKIKADEAAKIKADEEAKIKTDEEAKIKADEEAKIKADEEAAKLKADEAEAKLKAIVDEKLKMDEEAKSKTDEEAKIKVNEDKHGDDEANKSDDEIKTKQISNKKNIKIVTKEVPKTNSGKKKITITPQKPDVTKQQPDVVVTPVQQPIETNPPANEPKKTVPVVAKKPLPKKLTKKT